MAFHNEELSACHLAPLAVLSGDEVRYCAQCGAENPQTVSEASTYFVSKELELATRKWADGDLKWADLAREIMNEVNDYKELTLSDLRLQMADSRIGKFIFNTDSEQWQRVGESA